MYALSLAMTVGAAKNIAIVILLALLVVGYFIAKFVKVATTKALMLLAIGAIMLGAWTQRSNASECFDKLKANPTGGETCTFFGFEVSAPAQ